MRKKLLMKVLLAGLCLSLPVCSSVRVPAEEYEEEYDSSDDDSYEESDDGSYEGSEDEGYEEDYGDEGYDEEY